MTSKVFCLCGKIGSGKTTVARHLAETNKTITFNLDEIMEPLFGQTLGREKYIINLAICQNYVYNLADQILDRGLSVVFDFGFWSREDRRSVAERFSGHNVVFIYCPVSDEEQRARVFARNDSSDKTYSFTENMLKVLNGFFEEPNGTEGFNWISGD